MYPLLKIAFAMLIGCVIGIEIGIMPIGIVIALLVGVILLGSVVSLWFKSVVSEVILIMVLIVSMLWANYNQYSKPFFVAISATDFDAILLSEPTPKGQDAVCDLGILADGKLLKVKARFRQSVDDDALMSFPTGSGLSVCSRIGEPQNYHGATFDYRQWMRMQGYRGQMYIRSDCWKTKTVDIGSLSLLDRSLLRLKIWRYHCLQRISSWGLDAHGYAVVSAMTFGNKSQLPTDLRNSYSIAGASHLLALSGLHLGIVYACFMLFVSLYRRVGYAKVLHRDRWLDILVLWVIWFYVFMVGFSPSVVRAALMLTVYTLTSLLHRDRFSLNALALAAIVQLVLNPLIVSDIGFQLSFLSVFFILLFRPYLSLYFTKRFIVHKTTPRWLRLIAESAYFSLVAHVATVPLVAYYFHRFSNYFLLTNIVAVPLVSFILYWVVLLLLYSLFAPVPLLLTSVLRCVVESLNDYIQWVASLPGASVEGVHLSLVQVVLLYFMLFCIWKIFDLKKKNMEYG